MYKNVLRSIEGIDIFPVIGLVIFFGFFAAWFVYVMRMKKSEIEELERLPLDLELENDSNSQPHEHK